MENEKYDEALTIFESLDGYKDSDDMIIENKYNLALSLMDTKKYDEAITIFESLDGYKDSDDMIIENEMKILENVEIGDIIYFGYYEQDNDASNGKESIKWQVLDKQDDKLLVISKYILDSKQYNNVSTDVTWENCSLRTWLNDSFINTAFSIDEQALILNFNVSADKNPNYDTSPGSDTIDKIFLLSIDEVNKYFKNDESRRCAVTDYAKARGTYTSSRYSIDGMPTGWWWLRSPGYFQDYAADVNSGGDLDSYGYDVDNTRGGVRPALWINLKS